VLLELIQDLLHLESSRESLDKDCRTDTPLLDTKFAGSEAEDIIPKTSFQVMLHLWKVIVRTESAIDKHASVVEEVETEIKDGAGHGDAVDQDTRLVEVPAARSAWSRYQPDQWIVMGSTIPNEEDGGLIAQLVSLTTWLEVDFAPILTHQFCCKKSRTELTG